MKKETEEVKEKKNDRMKELLSCIEEDGKYNKMEYIIIYMYIQL
jgi:hypothetical protein